MKKKDVIIGATYRVKVSGKRTSVRITSAAHWGGWLGINTKTKRRVEIKSAQRLGSLLSKPKGVVAEVKAIADRVSSKLDRDAVIRAIALAPDDLPMNAQVKPAELAKKSGVSKAAIKALLKQDDGEMLTVGSAGHIYLTMTGKKKAKTLLRLAQKAALSPPAASAKAAARTTPKTTPEATGAKRGCLWAAVEVLGIVKAPMTTKAITKSALDRGLWTTKGKTPEATLYAAIIREIAKKGEDSRFRKAAPGLFELA